MSWTVVSSTSENSEAVSGSLTVVLGVSVVSFVFSGMFLKDQLGVAEGSCGFWTYVSDYQGIWVSISGQVKNVDAYQALRHGDESVHNTV